MYYDDKISSSTTCPDGWNKDDWRRIKSKLEAAYEKYKNVNIFFASYGGICYNDTAWVLFEEGGKLYEVNASHCSCYNLGGQWEPEKVNLRELENRLTKGKFGVDYGNEFKDELMKFLGI